MYWFIISGNTITWLKHNSSHYEFLYISGTDTNYNLRLPIAERLLVVGFKGEVWKESQVTVMQLNNLPSGLPTLQKTR